MKAKVWIARDKDGDLCLFPTKPTKKWYMFVCSNSSQSCLEIDKNSHPEITWENSPQQIYV